MPRFWYIWVVNSGKAAGRCQTISSSTRRSIDFPFPDRHRTTTLMLDLLTVTGSLPKLQKATSPLASTTRRLPTTGPNQHSTQHMRERDRPSTSVHTSGSRKPSCIPLPVRIRRGRQGRRVRLCGATSRVLVGIRWGRRRRGAAARVSLVQGVREEDVRRAFQ